MICYILQQLWASFRGYAAVLYQAIFNDIRLYCDVATWHPVIWH
jgi:hypothetical protein